MGERRGGQGCYSRVNMEILNWPSDLPLMIYNMRGARWEGVGGSDGLEVCAFGG